MTLYELIQQRGIEAIGRFYSTYRGIVITSDDPDSQNKVCVHLPSILRGVEVWAYPKHQQGGPGSGFKWLSPREGSIVYVEFENVPIYGKTSLSEMSFVKSHHRSLIQ